MRTIDIDGKRYAWRDILKMRREQKKTERKQQLALFELREYARPVSQRTPEGRLTEPTLFPLD